MWMPDEKLEIPKARFSENENVNYRDNNNVLHPAKVLNVWFNDLIVGYKYAIELNEPLNGMTKYITSEKRLSKVATEKAKPARKKSTRHKTTSKK